MLATEIHAVLTLLPLVLTLQRTVSLRADFLMLLDVPNQQHVTILIRRLAAHQLKHIRNMRLQLLSTLELEVVEEENADIAGILEEDDDCKEWQPTHPDHQSSIETICAQHLTH